MINQLIWRQLSGDLIDWEIFEAQRSKLNFSDIFAEYLGKLDIIFKILSVPFEMAAWTIFDPQTACHSLSYDNLYNVCNSQVLLSAKYWNHYCHVIFEHMRGSLALFLSIFLSLLLKNIGGRSANLIFRKLIHRQFYLS